MEVGTYPDATEKRKRFQNLLTAARQAADNWPKAYRQNLTVHTGFGEGAYPVGTPADLLAAYAFKDRLQGDFRIVREPWP